MNKIQLVPCPNSKTVIAKNRFLDKISYYEHLNGKSIGSMELLEL